MSHDASSLKARAAELLEHAGVTIGGGRPTDIAIHDERTYARVFAHG